MYMYIGMWVSMKDIRVKFSKTFLVLCKFLSVELFHLHLFLQIVRIYSYGCILLMLFKVLNINGLIKITVHKEIN